MKGIEILFWACVALVFYTYAGYGILLYTAVRIKERFKPRHRPALPAELPEVTLLVAAYNEEAVVAAKMENTLALNYPPTLLSIVWVTDGSTDGTNALLAEYPRAKVLFDAPRRGKSAALNRAVRHISTPLVIFTDANTMLGPESVVEIVKAFSDPKVGCVAGEKRIAGKQAQDATAGEGIYWRYESALKALDYRLCSAVGAAGELFAVRTELYMELPDDTLLDDFVLSMRIAQQGYKIAYCKEAYAEEEASADITQEAKRKIRIAAGGFQAIGRLKPLLNLFRYGTLSFQYLSHRVLRWAVAPAAWFALLPLNAVLAAGDSRFYKILMVLQLVFYGMALGGYILQRREIKNKFLFVPYYFIFMNGCALRGAFSLRKYRGTGVWEKARRKNS